MFGGKSLIARDTHLDPTKHKQVFSEMSKAQCFLKRDREKLLAVIEAGFGDLYAFNSMVHGLFPEGKSKTLAKGGKKEVEEVRV